MDLWIAPHNDDETLFGAFTLMRKHPLVAVVTDSWLQFNRGENITCEQRWMETAMAMNILGCPFVRIGIRDDIINEWMVTEKLGRFSGFDTVYVPAVQGGNPHHDLIGIVARRHFPNVKQYTTYSSTDLYTTGLEEVVPTPEELKLKNRALEYYTSQIKLPATAPHFEAIKGRSEWFL